jgi:uncharacterized SAM-binding protein YcdF (DUF218 family)
MAQPIHWWLAVPIGQLLESRISRPQLPCQRDLTGIIVLGGSTARVRTALQLAERYPNAAVVLSGPGELEVALALKSKNLSGRLSVDHRATNTYENALFSKDLVRPSSDQSWAVVTSAVHMPRAIGAFQSVGFPVLPCPVGDTPLEADARAASVWHEVFGLIGYWVLGRTRELYPSYHPTTRGA